MNMDTVILPLSDMHSGSSVALFPPDFVQFIHGNHTPTARDRELYGLFSRVMDKAAASRRGKRLIVVHNGDAIDGVHHSTRQVLTHVQDEQVDLHIELMDRLLRKAKFNRKAGDRLYYISGTESHTMDKEQRIAKDLPAESNPDGGHVFDVLKLQVNGRLVWFAHHGPPGGRGPNAGNSLRNFLRDIYWDCKRFGEAPPDLVVFGHTHKPTYNTYVQDFHTIHGIICPSWQRKTRFVYKVGAVERNEVGAAFVEIKADGEIKTPWMVRMENREQRMVV